MSRFHSITQAVLIGEEVSMAPQFETQPEIIIGFIGIVEPCVFLVDAMNRCKPWQMFVNQHGVDTLANNP